jgi:hypothetical protein
LVLLEMPLGMNGGVGSNLGKRTPGHSWQIAGDIRCGRRL